MRFPIVLTALLTVFAVCGANAQGLPAPDPAKLKLASANVLVIDAQSGQPLYSKGAEEVTPIASLTKLMTAIVTVESGLPLDEALAVDMDDFDYLKGTRSRLSLGTTLPRREMLQLALMSSENRAASTLARNYPGGVDAFVVAMNAKARALGMTRTRFEDPTGLSPNNVSTASDLARLVRASAQYPLIRDFSTTPSHYVEVQPTGRLLGFNNSNRLVSSADWDIQLQKTGYIREAGRCLVMLANVASKPMIIVLLDSIGKFTRLGDAQRVKYWLETGQTLPRAAVFGYKAPAPRAVNKSAKPRAAVKVKVKGKAPAAQNSRSSRSARAGGI